MLAPRSQALIVALLCMRISKAANARQQPTQQPFHFGPYTHSGKGSGKGFDKNGKGQNKNKGNSHWPDSHHGGKGAHKGKGGQKGNNKRGHEQVSGGADAAARPAAAPKQN